MVYRLLCLHVSWILISQPPQNNLWTKRFRSGPVCPVLKLLQRVAAAKYLDTKVCDTGVLQADFSSWTFFSIPINWFPWCKYFWVSFVSDEFLGSRSKSALHGSTGFSFWAESVLQHPSSCYQVLVEVFQELQKYQICAYWRKFCISIKNKREVIFFVQESNLCIFIWITREKSYKNTGFEYLTYCT